MDYGARRPPPGRPIRLAPDVASYRVQLASVLFEGLRYAEVVAATDEALALDPASAGALNLRGLALIHLGRRAAAAAVLEGARVQAPNDDAAHANVGWVLLHRGRTREAAAAFREALRLNPHSEWARRGLRETVKAWNVLYRLLLPYLLWMDRLSTVQRYAVIGGLSLGGLLLPPLLVVALPLLIVTWVGKPLFNLVLALTPDGRRIGSGTDRFLGVLVGGIVFGGAAAFVVAGVGGPWTLAPIGAFLLSLVVPIGKTLGGPLGQGCWAAASTVLLAAVGLAAVGALLLGALALAKVLGGVYLFGFCLFTVAFDNPPGA